VKTYQFHNPNVGGISNGIRAKHYIQAKTKKEAVRKFRDFMNAQDGIRCTLYIAESNLEKVYNQ
jgi:hypothetical protein